MEKFTVPQFIENEDKILGPITVRQFLIMFISAGIIFLLYWILSIPVFILSAVVVAAAAGVLAFMKINGQPFHFFLLNIVQTTKRPSLRVWRKDISSGDIVYEKKRAAQIQSDREKDIEANRAPAPKDVSSSRLSELALIVDTGGAYKSREERDVPKSAGLTKKPSRKN